MLLLEEKLPAQWNPDLEHICVLSFSFDNDHPILYQVPALV